MQYISTLEQLQVVVETQPKASILLGGDLVFVSTEKDAIDDLLVTHEDEYIVQPKRKAGKGRSATFMYVAVTRRAISILEGYSGHVGIAADQFLAYGLSLKDNSIVVGGSVDEETQEAIIEILVFTDTTLVSYHEKEIRYNSVQIDAAIGPIVNAHPSHYVHWCNCLPDLTFDGFGIEDRFIEGADYTKGQSGIKRKLVTKTKGAEEPWHLWQGLTIATIGFVAMIAVVGLSWSSLQAERELYFSEIAGYEDTYRNSGQSLQLLRHRDFLLNQPSQGTQVLDTVDVLLARLSVLDGVIIHRVTVFGEVLNDQAPRQSDFGLVELGPGDSIIEISLPVFDQSARVQGEQMIRGLSDRSGLNLRMINHKKEIVVSNDIEKEYWRYQILGSLPHAI